MEALERKDLQLNFGESATLAVGTAKDFDNKIKLNNTSAAGMAVVIRTTEALAGTSVTATFDLKGSDDDSSYSTVATSPALGTTALALDSCITIAIPRDCKKKYLKLEVTAAGTAVTKGKFEAFIDTYVGK